MIEVAKKAALSAGKIALFLSGKRHTFISKKKLGDFTTEADLKSEREILRILQSSFPTHNYLSEEIGEKDNGSSYRWVIDPIDGTIPYSSGLPTYGISIGLLKKRKPILGVINLPALGLLFWAEAGRGAYLNGKRIRVSKKGDLIESVIGFGLAHAGGRKEELKRIVEPIADKVRYMPDVGSTVLPLCYVACGFYDGYLHSAYPWDYVAGAAIIEEAGGEITDFGGKPIDWSKDWIDLLASNAVLHDKLCQLIK